MKKIYILSGFGFLFKNLKKTRNNGTHSPDFPLQYEHYFLSVSSDKFAFLLSWSIARTGTVNDKKVEMIMFHLM